MISQIKPIAHIYTDFSDKFGIPRQSGRVKELCGRIVFEKEYRNEQALRGIEEFSHLWLIFDFSKAHRDTFSPTVRPPRLGGNKRVGVFASRSPFRPNNLGLSCVKLDRIEKTSTEGVVLVVSGVDILSGTPIYDVKPYIPYADCIKDAKGSYSDEFESYRLEVSFPQELLEMIPQEKQSALINCLADDPRPSYQDDDRIYSMSFAGFDVSFKVSGNILTVTNVIKL
ncbi:MAG: tRNA (N6-threonylcarbamoyladenosine(37)-N6)-methyltransferase TrmO [Oscillospiraceae bacterium]|nr:tRNA (N6-threonylcarbamoyladenosine(37)-N6)-methyltransferase TrmO [Oscillospiraceae bacterium]